MNKRIYLLLSVGFVLIALLGAVCLYQSVQIEKLETRFENKYMFTLDSRTYPGNQLDSMNDTLEILENQINNLEEHVYAEDGELYWYIGRHNQRLQELEYGVMQLQADENNDE